MKKIVMLLAIAAMTCFSTSAFAIHEGEGKAVGNLADITIGGSMDIRSRDFVDLDLTKNNGAGSQVDTQERVRLDVNVKAGDVKGKVTIENDWDNFGRFEQPQGDSTTATSSKNTARLDVREAWMLFPVPSTPIYVKGGHMLLQLGNGWWFRSMKYGSDAWVAFTDIDPVHVGVFDVKVSEGLTASSDDIDAYGLFVAVKASDTMKFGGDVTYANDRRNGLGFGTPGATNPTGETQAYNIGLNADVKAGPVGLKAEADLQTGKAKGNDAKFKGNQVVVQGNVGMDPVTINFTAAYGSGKKVTDTSKDYKQMITFLDADPHYTFLYEYKIAGPCGIHTGFCDTTALSVGAMFAATTSLSVGADVWFMQASDKVKDVTSTDPNATTSELGTEVDVKINWTLADNLTWNWTLGYLDPGKGLGKDPSMGAQGVLSMKF